MQKQTDYRESRMLQYPETVSIIVVKDEDGRYNPMSASWVMLTSIEPRMIAISIGFERYTYELMRRQSEFVISFPSEGMAAEVKLFGSESGRDMDKLKKLETPTQPATVIDGLLLSEATVNYECVLKGSLITGDHMIFSGEIVASHKHVDELPRLYVLAPKKFGGL
jgi:flavin reductase (DIM6/NTAB) family NADH-FMN oxidoreductase RutF